MIRDQLTAAITAALSEICGDFGPDAEVPQEINIERPKDRQFGDYTTNVCMVLARSWKSNPREIAVALTAKLEMADDLLERTEIAGPGFINIYLQSGFQQNIVRKIAEQGSSYGHLVADEPKRIQVEFVSANPVGSLHVGHGRWAAVGDCLARILEAAGHQVEREFYVNDFGAQMGLFGESVAARYRELLGETIVFPEQGYQGSYIVDIAQEIVDSDGRIHLTLSDDEQKELFKERAYRQVLEHLKSSLSDFGVDYDVWFSERELHTNGSVQRAVDSMVERNHAYIKDGATWMRTSDFGDEKDRVLVRSDGNPTYFAADVAYHADKLSRGFDLLINIWGADHHGYVPRVKAAIESLGSDPSTLEVIIGQLVNLSRNGVPVRMSKRTGEMVTFEDLLDEVGADATRFFFLMRSTDSAVDFDIELAKERSSSNPVYYVQYAHARVCSIIRTAAERGQKMPSIDEADLSLLVDPSEITLMQELSKLPEIVQRCADERAPHKMTTYLRSLAEAFHSFYTNCRVVGVEKEIAGARLRLVDATRQVVSNGLGMLGVTAPDQM